MSMQPSWSIPEFTAADRFRKARVSGIRQPWEFRKAAQAALPEPTT